MWEFGGRMMISIAHATLNNHEARRPAPIQTKLPCAVEPSRLQHFAQPNRNGPLLSAALPHSGPRWEEAAG